jgi:serine/threonine protein kinase
VKLFDFGLARELDHSDEDNAEDSNVYVMSSEVGSLRYMSPEVANGEKYNHKVDTYAFGEIDSFPIFYILKNNFKSTVCTNSLS